MEAAHWPRSVHMQTCGRFDSDSFFSECVFFLYIFKYNPNRFIANICNNIANASVSMICRPWKLFQSNAFPIFGLVIAFPYSPPVLAHLHTNIGIIILSLRKPKSSNIYQVTLNIWTRRKYNKLEVNLERIENKPWFKIRIDWGEIQK